MDAFDRGGQAARGEDADGNDAGHHVVVSGPQYRQESGEAEEHDEWHAAVDVRELQRPRFVALRTSNARIVQLARPTQLVFKLTLSVHG